MQNITPALPLMNAPFTLVRDDHYVVTRYTRKGEVLEFGAFLPLTKKAASQYLRTVRDSHLCRVIKRTTARRTGLI